MALGCFLNLLCLLLFLLLPAVRTKAANFTAINITFENSANRNGHQAVALSIASDRAAVYNCIIRSFQVSLRCAVACCSESQYKTAARGYHPAMQADQCTMVCFNWRPLLCML